MNLLTRLTCGLMLLSSLGAAHASEHLAAARIGGVQIVVIDLTPGDSLAAGYTILASESDMVLESALRHDPGQATRSERHQGYTLAAVTTSVSQGGSFARAGRNGPFGELSVASHGGSDLPATGFALGYAADSLVLQVQPGTRLLLSGQYSLERTLSGDPPDELLSQAQVYVRMDDRWGTRSAALERLSNPFDPNAGPQQRKDGAFAFLFDAYDQEPLYLLFSAYTSVQAPVPAPAGWVMLLTGLTGLALAGFPAGGKSRWQRRKASFSV